MEEKRRAPIKPSEFIRNHSKLVNFVPKPVGYFSLTQHGEYLNGLNNLKYVATRFLHAKQSCNFDLNKDYEKRETAIEVDFYIPLRLILEFILRNQGISDGVDFICTRGALVTLMCSPYHRNDWIILASKCKGKIYLSPYETEQQKFSRHNESESQKRIFAYGFKFEDYMLGAHPNAEGTVKEPTKIGEKLFVVFNSEINGKKLLYSAEVDGVDSSLEVKNLRDLQQANFVELKLILPKTGYKEQNFAKLNLCKWWCQSTLVRTNDIVIGYRDEDGVCAKTEPIKVDKIPEKATAIFKNSGIPFDLWKSGGCMNFLDEFLKNVQEVMKHFGDLDVVQFEYYPYKDQSMHYFKLSGSENFVFTKDFLKESYAEM